MPNFAVAAPSWKPTASRPLGHRAARQHHRKPNPGWNVIFNGRKDGKRSRQDGWEIVAAMAPDAIERTPNPGPKMLLAALQDVAKVLHNETDAADKLAADTVKLPPGILTAAVDSKRPA